MSSGIAVSERGISVPALRRLARRSKNNAALSVLLLVEELAGDDGLACVTGAAIAGTLGLSVTGAHNAVTKLIVDGLLASEPLPGRRQGYRLRLLDISERDERPLAGRA